MDMTQIYQLLAILCIFLLAAKVWTGDVTISKWHYGIVAFIIFLLAFSGDKK